MTSYNYLTSIDVYTAAVEADFNVQEPTLADPIKDFEDECIRSFSIPFVEDDDFDIDDDFDEDDSSSTKERHPYSANAFDYSFGDVYQSNWYKDPRVHCP